MEEERARRRLLEGALERTARMPPGEAVEWIAGHRLLSLAGEQRLPPAVRDALGRRARDVAARNLFLVDRFRAAVEVLDDIPLCPLKGMYLLDTVYRDDPQSRPLSDVDVLVPEERVDEAVERLETLSLLETEVSHRIRNVSPHRLLAGDGWTLEVHTRLGIKHGWTSTWEEVAPVRGTVHGREVFVLDAETMLVHLVSHLVKHRPFSRLVWVEDVLRWLVRGVDGERVIERSRELGSFRSVAAGARTLRRALGTDALADLGALRGTLADRVAVRLNERLAWRDLAADPWCVGPGSPFGRTLSAFLLADRTTDRWKLLRAKIFEVRKR